METRNIFKLKKVIDVQDWDKLVEDTYGKIYSFQQQEGCQDRGTFHLSISKEEVEDTYNDSIPEEVNGEEMGIKFNVWLARDVKQKLSNPEDQMNRSIALWWKRNFYPDIQIVANDLCRRGLIEEGEYDINIDW